VSCEDYSWKDPIVIGTTSTPTSSTVRFSEVASRAGRTFVVGNSVPSAGAANATSALVIKEISGRTLAPPAGDFLFAFPRAGIDGTGRLHLVWGEPLPDDRPRSLAEWGLQDVRSVWTASTDPATGEWSTPQRLLETRVFPLAWSQLVQGLGALGPASLGTAVLVPMTDPADRDGRDISSTVAVLQLDHGRWVSKLVPLPGRAASAAVWSDGTTSVLVYVGSASPRAADNTVVVMRSIDGGRSWSLPTIIGDSPRGVPIDALAIAASPKTLHVLWKQSNQGGKRVMRHRASDDWGATWTESSDLPVPSRSGGESVTVDGCGNVHLVFGAIGEDRLLELRHAVFAKSWTPPALLFPSLVTYGAHLSHGQDGRVWLSFIGIPRDARSPDANVSYVAELSLR
jgi:hypothetical protein